MTAYTHEQEAILLACEIRDLPALAVQFGRTLCALQNRRKKLRYGESPVAKAKWTEERKAHIRAAWHTTIAQMTTALNAMPGPVVSARMIAAYGVMALGLPPRKPFALQKFKPDTLAGNQNPRPHLKPAPVAVMPIHARTRDGMPSLIAHALASDLRNVLSEPMDWRQACSWAAQCGVSLDGDDDAVLARINAERVRYGLPVWRIVAARGARPLPSHRFIGSAWAEGGRRNAP